MVSHRVGVEKVEEAELEGDIVRFPIKWVLKVDVKGDISRFPRNGC